MSNVIFKKIEPTFRFEEYEFDCEIEELNQFFYHQAKEYINYGYTQMYIFEDARKLILIGYFAVCCCNVQVKEKELVSVEKIARFVPGILIGKLAIDKKYQNQKLGKDLIKKAIIIAVEISKIVGCRCVFVDALVNKRSINFYQNIGFDFVNDSLGIQIYKNLEENIKIERETIKMFLDLSKFKN